MSRKIKVKTEAAGQRLDKFLSEKLELSRSQVQKLIKCNAVLVNDKSVAPHYSLKINDKLEIKRNTQHTAHSTQPILKSSCELRAASCELIIIANTPDYLVVEKPAGLPVHPDNVHPQNTLIQQIVKKYPKIKKVGENEDRPGVVHRLDKEVSGLLVIAKTPAMFEHLKNQFQNHQIKKEYLALVRGHLTPETGEINFPIDRGREGLMVARPVSQAGKFAQTAYEVLKYFINYTFVKVIIKTGRTHQIRVHFKALGHPVVGDTLYTIKKQKADKIPLPRLFLHAETLGFTDLQGHYQEFHADPPDILKDYLNKIK
jgi:23S rRNA pseudouridine1911/1915/1917 synthase